MQKKRNLAALSTEEVVVTGSRTIRRPIIEYDVVEEDGFYLRFNHQSTETVYPSEFLVRVKGNTYRGTALMVAYRETWEIVIGPVTFAADRKILIERIRKGFLMRDLFTDKD